MNAYVVSFNITFIHDESPPVVSMNMLKLSTISLVKSVEFSKGTIFTKSHTFEWILLII